MALDYAADKTVWEGPVDGGGCLGAYDPAGGVYLALLAEPPGPLPGWRQPGAAGAIRQFDAEEYPGDEALLDLLRPLTSDWPAESRNKFNRWFIAGRAGDVEAAKAALQEARDRLMGRR